MFYFSAVKRSAKVMKKKKKGMAVRNLTIVKTMNRSSKSQSNVNKIIILLWLTSRILCQFMLQQCVSKHFHPDTNRFSVTHQPAWKEVASIPDLTKYMHLPCPALANHHIYPALPCLITTPALPCPDLTKHQTFSCPFQQELPPTYHLFLWMILSPASSSLASVF